MSDDESWRELEGTWDRLRWSRLRAGYDRAKDAADSMGIRPNTYTAYERPPTASKSVPLDHQLAARFAKKFKVDWEWLLTGSGAPYGMHETIRAAIRDVPQDSRSRVEEAIVAVINAFKKAAS